MIARVGDQAITFSEINTMLNSTAVVGVSVPALGTPERDAVRIVILDRMVDANLIYLDALRKGLDQDPRYRRDIDRLMLGLLADMQRMAMQSDITVTDEEIMNYYNTQIAPGQELTEDGRAQIEAVLRKEKVHVNAMQLRSKLREGIDIKILEKNYDPDGDDGRADDTPVVEAGDLTITWGEVKSSLIAAGIAATDANLLADIDEARLGALEKQIDIRLLAHNAKDAGFELDPVFQRRLGEFSKTRLINLHRADLAEQYEPSDEQLEAFFEDQGHRITVPEFRRVQMVVLASEDEAKDVKRRVEAREMTFFEAAQRHSIAPDAKKDLGEIGWVQKGKVLFPELEEVVFAIGPGEIGGPVQVSDDWHIMRVTDVREAQRDSLDQLATRKEARRLYIKDRIDAYTVALRKSDFPVEVYQDRIIQLAQAEADMVAQLAE
ncbi:MAG: hypothetical protein HKP57_05025, partial [Halobacteria archaeon]|nr:hypothetical protein [Halobacteria archaeon]